MVGIALLGAAAGLGVFVLDVAASLSEGGHWGAFAALRGLMFGAIGLVAACVVAALGVTYLVVGGRQLQRPGRSRATMLVAAAGAVLTAFTIVPSLLADGGDNWMTRLADNPYDGMLFLLLGLHAVAAFATGRRLAAGLATLAIAAVGGALVVPFDAWDARIGSLLSRRSLATHREPVAVIGMPADGATVVVGNRDRLTAFRTSDGREIWRRRIAATTIAERGLVFSADGNRLAYVEERNVHLLDAETGAILHRLEHDNVVDSAAFAGGGAWLITALRFSDGWIVWDADSGERRRVLRIDCKRLASNGVGDSVWSRCGHVPTAWHIENETHAATIEIRELEDFSLSPDGSRVLTLEGFSPTPRSFGVYDAATSRQLATIPLAHGTDLGGCIDEGARCALVQYDKVSLVDIAKAHVTELCAEATLVAAGGAVVVAAGCSQAPGTLHSWQSNEL